eukprot:3771865-Amphidinium_carterae.1
MTCTVVLETKTARDLSGAIKGGWGVVRQYVLCTSKFPPWATYDKLSAAVKMCFCMPMFAHRLQELAGHDFLWIGTGKEEVSLNVTEAGAALKLSCAALAALEEMSS